MVDVITLCEPMGKALVTEPVVASLILGGRLVELLGVGEQRKEILSSLVSDNEQLALAHSEYRSGDNPAYVNCSVERDGDDYLISGDKIMVLNGPAADKFLVTARSSGGERDRAGIEVFIVNANAIKNSSGSTLRAYATVDGMPAADIHFDALRVSAVDRIGNPATNIDALEIVLDEAVFAFSAEAIGAMEVLIGDTVEYAKSRKQFGTAIGKFQALQFRMVDMWMGHQKSLAALHLAAGQMPAGGADRRRAASALKVVVSETAKFVGENAIQLHGAIGTTDELRVSHYFKRLLCIESLLGSVDFHLDRYAALLDD